MISYSIANLRQNKNWKKKSREKEPYQGVVEANVSLQAGANMVELHDRYFCCGDGQDVLQTW